MFHYKYDKSLGTEFHRELPNTAERKLSKKGFWTRKFVEFCKRTDLHGYKYIVMEELNPIERSVWAVAVLLSITVAAYFVYAAYKWYARNPIITVIESTQSAIWDVPFPAVTICNLNTISKKAARTFANKMKLPPNVTTQTVFETIRLASLLHSTFTSSPEQKDRLRVLQQVLDFNKLSLKSMFATISPAVPCSNLVERCMWKNALYRCDQLFQQVFTMYNVCCAFNYYALHVDNSIRNVDDELLQLTTPRRVASCGYQTALTVLLNTDPDDYYSATVATQGTLVLIDSAYNLPNQDTPVRMVNPSTEVLIALSPERTYSTSGIKAFSPDQRQCYYSNEVTIGDFRQYSLHNCIAFQRMEIIKRLCECVPFFFPVTDYPRICNFYDLECLENAIRPTNDEMMSKLDKENIFNCLPECEHYDYPIEAAMGKLAKRVHLSGLPFFMSKRKATKRCAACGCLNNNGKDDLTFHAIPKNIESNNLNFGNRSLLNVFFNDLVSTRFRRDVYFNWQNFLAAFGGLLSLMLGFTLISGVDLILFFMLQLIYECAPQYKQPPSKSPTKDKKKRLNAWMDKSMRHWKLTEKDIDMWKMKMTTAHKY